MAVNRTDQLIEWLYSVRLPDGVLRFDELLLQGAKDALSLDDDSANRLVDRNAAKIWSKFRVRIASELEAKVHPLVLVLDDGTRRLQSLASVRSSQSSIRFRRIGGRLESRPFVYRCISDANHRLYEAMCCIACQCCGAKNVHLTPKGDEGGIDFLALIETPRGYLQCTGLNRIRVVGQSKKHGEPVSVGHVREFDATVDDIRRESSSINRHLPEWFRNVSSPIVGWIFGHQGFQSGARGRAQKSGLMLFDSRALTEMVVLSPVASPWCGDTDVGSRFRALAVDFLKASERE